MIDYIFQIALVALVVAMWADVSRVHKKLKELDLYVRYMYYLLYYQYYGQAQQSREESGEPQEDSAAAAKESCVMELISKYGCMDINELIEKCGVSKSFIMNKIYRLKKLVSITKEGKVCPKN